MELITTVKKLQYLLPGLCLLVMLKEGAIERESESERKREREREGMNAASSNGSFYLPSNKFYILLYKSFSSVIFFSASGGVML